VAHESTAEILQKSGDFAIRLDRVAAGFEHELDYAYAAPAACQAQGTALQQIVVADHFCSAV
jgi:hypothetical protein